MFREDFSGNESTVTDILAESRNEMNNLVQEINEYQEQEKPFPNQAETYWDSWERTDKYYPNGKIPESAIRIINGRKYMLDIGLTFVLTKSGDTRDGVAKEVSETKPAGRNLSYLKPGASKYQSINIPANKFPANRWIPMPIEAKNRILTQEQFLNYASEAIDEIIAGETERDKPYSKQVKLLVDKIGKQELMCLMMATAKQESGGAPLGQFVFHRWESHRKDFSHSIFHIMLEGPGLEARKKLGMTPGQMNHPKNSCKMFLAFTIEKHLGRYKGTIAPSAEKTADFIYHKYKNTDAWITYYNGGGWKKTNPNYAQNITKYKQDAHNTFTNPKSAKDYALIAEKQAINTSRRTQNTNKHTQSISSEIENSLQNNKDKLKEDTPKEKLSADDYHKSIEKEIRATLKGNYFRGEKYITYGDVSQEEIDLAVNQTIKYLKEVAPNEQFNPAIHDIIVTADETRLFIKIQRENDKSYIGNGATTIPRETETN